MTRKARILRFGPSHRDQRLLSEALPEVGEDPGLHEAPAPAANGASVGVDEQDLPILFVPFRQRRHELFASMPGQGVGLAIAKRLSSLIGASLSVRRRTAGHGTVFVLSVPSPLAIHTAQGSGRTLH